MGHLGLEDPQSPVSLNSFLMFRGTKRWMALDSSLLFILMPSSKTRKSSQNWRQHGWGAPQNQTKAKAPLPPYPNSLGLKFHRLPLFTAHTHSSGRKPAPAKRCLKTSQTDISQNIQVLEVQSRNNVCKAWRKFREERKKWGPKDQGDKGTHLVYSRKGI